MSTSTSRHMDLLPSFSAPRPGSPLRVLVNRAGVRFLQGARSGSGAPAGAARGARHDQLGSTRNRTGDDGIARRRCPAATQARGNANARRLRTPWTGDRLDVRAPDRPADVGLRAFVHGLSARRADHRVHRDAELPSASRRSRVLEGARQYCSLRLHRRSWLRGARTWRRSPDRIRDCAAIALSRPPVPAGHGDTHRDGDRLGIHASPDLRPRERDAQVARLRSAELVAGRQSRLPTLAIIGVWQQFGFNMVLFLAGVVSIPKYLYEAAAVDGVPNAWERFRLVIWPMLGPVTLFVIVISAIRSFQVFDTVHALTKGGPNKATEVLLYSMYAEGFEFFRTGYAAAIAVIFVILVLALTLLKTSIIERRIHY